MSVKIMSECEAGDIEPYSQTLLLWVLSNK